MVDTAFLRQLEGFALTTAAIIYRLPDHQMLLQSYIWQAYDLAPRFPKLIDFLDFWEANLDGPLSRAGGASRADLAHRVQLRPRRAQAALATRSADIPNPVIPGLDPGIHAVMSRWSQSY